MAIVNNIHNKTPQLIPKPTSEDEGKIPTAEGEKYVLKTPTGGGFSLPLLYETTTQEEVRWIDTGANAFEAKNIMIIRLVANETATNEKPFSGACSIHNKINSIDAPFSNYALAYSIPELLTNSYGAVWSCIAVRGDSGMWNSLWQKTNKVNRLDASPKLNCRNDDNSPCTGIVIGDASAMAGTRVLGKGSTLKIWGV